MRPVTVIVYSGTLGVMRICYNERVNASLQMLKANFFLPKADYKYNKTTKLKKSVYLHREIGLDKPNIKCNTVLFSSSLPLSHSDYTNQTIESYSLVFN